MKKVFVTVLIFSAFMICSFDAAAQTEATAAAQSRAVGVVTEVDAAGGKLKVKTETGETVSVATNAKSAVLRLPPGETSAQNATRIALSDIAVGDRVFARGTTASDGSIDARQVVVTGGAPAQDAQAQQRQREDFRQRGLIGRITALDASKKEATVQSRSREGTGPILVAVSDSTKLFRYAPDSMNIKDATRATFADLRVGDQVRALGARNPEGTRFAAEEIVAGSMGRISGQVVAVNAAKNEITVKNAQGQNVTVAVGQRSSLRRVTAEAAATLEANRPRQEGRPQGQRGQAAAGENRQTAQGQDGQQRQPRREGAPGPGGQRGRGFQEMLESLPLITVADLKKGDIVFVSGSEGADPSHMTAITLITGDAAFMSRFMPGGQNRGPQSPGLPGDVAGGGVGPAERPNNP